MKFIVISALFAGFLLVGAPNALAQETVIVENPIVIAEEGFITELTDLKVKEQEAEGALTKFILRIRIRQLENQLNIKEALSPDEPTQY